VKMARNKEGTKFYSCKNHRIINILNEVEYFDSVSTLYAVLCNCNLHSIGCRIPDHARINLVFFIKIITKLFNFQFFSKIF
jgi:hypothetical protein